MLRDRDRGDKETSWVNPLGCIGEPGAPIGMNAIERESAHRATVNVFSGIEQIDGAVCHGGGVAPAIGAHATDDYDCGRSGGEEKDKEQENLSTHPGNLPLLALSIQEEHHSSGDIQESASS
jgi:hypothetical protein